MWIVELALRRPHTFIVMAITIALFGVLSICRMAIDIFPVIDIPLVSCIWTYQGMSPYDMENLVTSITERALISTLSGIQRIESMSLSGMSIIKVYLQQGTSIGEDVAQVASVGTAILRQLPRGISPPFVTASSATDVPVVQLGLWSKTMSEAQLFDIANNFLRSQLATVQGTITPYPYGGKYRQVMVDLEPRQLLAHGLSPYDVVEALKNQSVVNPTGTLKTGPYEYIVVLNDIPDAIEKLNDFPVRTVKETVIFVKDVAHVHDGNQPQTNIVNRDGRRAILFNILKSGKASTLTVVKNVKDALPRLRSMVPPECHIDVITDASKFVKECVSEVVREAVIAATLTAIMMLALLGSWRSTLIVATSIPLAILSSIICLNITGQTINSMTLGGLALAVGMLVDDATVAIENLHVNLAMGKSIDRAILDGAEQVALPALVSTLSICIVFVPLVFLTEPSRSLFVPLGMAVVFAMLASYGLSRTVVPLMSKSLLAGHHAQKEGGQEKSPGFFGRIYLFIDSNFEGVRENYKSALSWVLDHPFPAASLFLGFYTLSFLILPSIGEEYFPTIDAGMLRLHLSAHAGTRLEETARIFNRVESAIRNLIPQAEVEGIVDNIGLPVSGINYAYSDSQTIGEADGEILITLKEKRSHSTAYYEHAIRQMLNKDFPQCSHYFQPADIVTQMLDAGLPAPIDVRVAGFAKEPNYQFALQLKNEIQKVPGAVDVMLHQVTDAPHVFWEVDRTRTREVGLTQNDVSQAMLISLSSSFQTLPNFWVNPKSGICYNLATQTPPYRLQTMDDVRTIPVTPTSAQEQLSEKQPVRQPEMLLNLATPTRKRTPQVVNHLNVAPVYDIFVSCHGRDLGGVSGDIQNILDRHKQETPRGAKVFMGGQALSMKVAFIALIGGLFFALVLVYLLLVVNFQSWSDPLIILMATPGAFSGIIWSLFVTQTAFSVPALMGTIMTVGVASANSILMVTFAKEQKALGLDAKTSALNAGYQRFRPVIMTATAMIIGMIPMALGSGQGGSQNAPIGRAVIGGLTVATFSTLLFVPLIFYMLRSKEGSKETGN
jgi:multidrug efflux pump subunit AcrB